MVNSTSKRLVARLKELRKLRGVTQEEFAELCGLKFKHYQALEAGRKIDFRMSTLERIAKGFGVEAYELLAPEFPKVKPIKKRA